MIKFTTGDIISAETQALVNTVNCEGFMGKGIAYQFKLNFPENNKAYTKSCKNGMIAVGKVFPFKEDGKVIFNFPTKNKWREKSQYDFIERGMLSLKTLIKEWDIQSIAIPPLGCGNGGLDWHIVKNMLLSSLQELENDVQIWIFEPSNSIIKSHEVKKAPRLSFSHLLLMNLKLNLNKFNKTRLQKTAYLINYLSNESFFKFEAYNFGPYAHSLEILSKDIAEYQIYYNFNTEKAYKHAKSILVSDSILNKEKNYIPFLEKAASIVNNILDDRDLELMSTILYVIDRKYPIGLEEIFEEFKNWSEYKSKKFPKKKIENGIKLAVDVGLVEKNLMGFSPQRMLTSNSF